MLGKLGMASGILHKRGIRPNSLDLEVPVDSCWEDVTCPICLDFPHNGVLIRCSSYENGCRPFICDTDQTRSNCLERFKSAYGLSSSAKFSCITNVTSLGSLHVIPPNPNNRPACPLCRGDVVGWIVIDEARQHLNLKKRCCEENHCSYVGNFSELQKHTQLKHPNSRPSEIDPARRLDWENFQQSSDIIDVLSTIHAQVPNGVVLGDYVIEYGDEENGDDYEVLHRVRGSWWASCIFCRNRRRTRARERRGSGRQSSNWSSSDNSNLEGPTISVDIREYRFDESDEEFRGTATGPAASRQIASHYRDRYGRRRSHIYEH